MTRRDHCLGRGTFTAPPSLFFWFLLLSNWIAFSKILQKSSNREKAWSRLYADYELCVGTLDEEGSRKGNNTKVLYMDCMHGREVTRFVGHLLGGHKHNTKAWGNLLHFACNKAEERGGSGGLMDGLSSTCMQWFGATHVNSGP